MIFDLSSKITLERIPVRYYRTADPVEAIRQTRFEKLRTEIYETETEGAAVVAREIASLIRLKAEKGQTCVKRLILHWLFLVLKRRSKRWWSVAVELVDEGVRGGELVELSTASMPLCNAYRP